MPKSDEWPIWCDASGPLRETVRVARDGKVTIADDLTLPEARHAISTLALIIYRLREDPDE